MISGNKIIKPVFVEKLLLIPIQPTHHRPNLPQITRKIESQHHEPIKLEFCNSITLLADHHRRGILEINGPKQF
jgi:hypothetical protein